MQKDHCAVELKNILISFMNLSITEVYRNSRIIWLTHTTNECIDMYSIMVLYGLRIVVIFRSGRILIILYPGWILSIIKDCWKKKRRNTVFVEKWDLVQEWFVHPIIESAPRFSVFIHILFFDTNNKPWWRLCGLVKLASILDAMELVLFWIPISSRKR